jgi:hypothetical protein
MYHLLFIIVLLFPTYINSKRCYKSDATDACETIISRSLSNDKYETIDYEHYF